MPFQDPEIAAQNRKNQRYYKVTPKGVATARRYRQTHRLMFVLEYAYHRARKMGYAEVDTSTLHPKPADNLCEHCRKPPGKQGLCLDHDHETGRFRGWVCARCNLAFAAFGDSVVGLRQAISYMLGCLPHQRS